MIRMVHSNTTCRDVTGTESRHPVRGMTTIVGAPVAATSVPAAAAPTVRPEHMERIEAAAAEVLSANTRRAYATAWRAWVAWCAAEGVEPMPAPPILVAAYLAERGEAGAGISTLRTAVAAIAHEHGSRGVPSPAVHPGVRRVLRGIARGRPPRAERRSRRQR